MTEQDIMAAIIRAQMQGEVTPSAEEMYTLFNDDTSKKKTKSSSGTKKTRQATAKQEEKLVVRQRMEKANCYRNLPYTFPVRVVFNNHDIKYKEQRWKIHERQVVYNIELVDNAKIARDISLKFDGGSEKAAERAYKGETRYYKIVTYESVPNGWEVIGYVKVSFNSKENRLVTRTKLFDSILKQANCDTEQAKKVIVSTVKENIG
jgi:hypothetical protein